MKFGKLAGRGAISLPRRQRGLVLLITLIVLVAMMLAGIGMMRSIDTTTMIAGNVAFRESTLHAGDSGMNAAFSKLLTITSVLGDRPALYYSDGDSTAYINPQTGVTDYYCTGMSASLCTGNNVNFPGYRSTPLKSCEIYPPAIPPATANPKQCLSASDYQWWANAANWVGAPSITVNDTAGQPFATVYYWIHRMCEVPDTSPGGSLQTCQTIQESVKVTGSSMQVGTTKFTATSVYYRVTTKSIGPRNTVTYAQEMVLIPE